MKKLLMILLLTTPILAQAIDKTTCENAGGTVITANGVNYCKSRTEFNWWNARTWCHSLGGADLVDILEACPNYIKKGTCPELNVGIDSEVWMQNVPNATDGYTVLLSSGTVIGSHNSRIGSHGWVLHPALCR